MLPESTPSASERGMFFVGNVLRSWRFNQSLSISFNLFQSHSISFNLIQSLSISFNLFQSHSISFNLIQSHSISFNLFQSLSISFNLFQSLSISFISFNLFQSLSISFNLFHFAPGIGADSPQGRSPNGQQERQSDRRKLLTATMLPPAFRPRTMSGKPDGEQSEPGRPKKNNDRYEECKNKLCERTELFLFIQTIFLLILL